MSKLAGILTATKQQLSQQPQEETSSLESCVSHEDLLRDFTRAAHMAELCHDRLLKLGPRPLANNTLKDWQDFLIELYDNARKVYPLHADLMEPEEREYLRRSFKA